MMGTKMPNSIVGWLLGVPRKAPAYERATAAANQSRSKTVAVRSVAARWDCSVGAADGNPQRR
jgi:hypothetical protein